jgi:exodeoxyribonuclease VII large subunit
MDLNLTPSALVNLFANAMPVQFTEQSYRLKGIYLAGKGVVYGGFYYDGLRDEVTDASITLIVPALVRAGMENQQLVEVTGYLQRKVQNVGARIELQFVVMELISTEAKGISEEQVKVFELLQEKATLGYRDVDGFPSPHSVLFHRSKKAGFSAQSHAVDCTVYALELLKETSYL